MTNKSQNDTPITGGIGNGSVNTSTVVASSGKKPSEDVYAEALKQVQITNNALLERNNQLEYEIKSLKNQLNGGSSNSLDKLAELLGNVITNNAKPVNMNTENLNRSTDFRNTVDGRSLMETQQIVNEFRTEEKVNISIPKMMSNYFGPTLAVSVNGVRVSIPCDGKTYWINKTHAMHAKEKLAKLDLINSSPEDNVIEIG